MDKLTKDQKDEYAVSFAALALYDGGVSSSLRIADECEDSVIRTARAYHSPLSVFFSQ